MTVIVTHHACQRYVERVDPRVTLGEAADIIAGAERAIEAATRFGAHVVRMGTGAKLVLHDGKVVTVLARRQISSRHMLPVGVEL
jgi:hypothetical protein